MSERDNLKSQKRAEARLSDSEFVSESESDLFETADSCQTDDHVGRYLRTSRNNPLRRHRNLERDYQRLQEENSALRIERDNYKKLAFGLFTFLVFVFMYFQNRRPRTANIKIIDIHQDHDNNVVNDQADVDGVDALENIDLVNGNENIVDAGRNNENQINDDQPGNNEEVPAQENPVPPPVINDEVPVQENRPDESPVVNNNQNPIIQCQNYCPNSTLNFGVYAPQPEGNRGRRGLQPNEMPEAHV